MEIKIIGKKSSNQMKLIKNIKKAISHTSMENTSIQEIEKNDKYSNYETPILILNDSVISEGRVLTEREISRCLKLYMKASEC